MDEIKKKEFENAAKLMHDWICKYGDPYTTVVIQQDSAEVHSTEMRINMEVPD